MKVFILIFTLLFSFSVLADCCNSVELDDCKAELLQSSDHEEDNHSSAAGDMCHCSFSCSVKILTHQSNKVGSSLFSLETNFSIFIQHFKNLDPSPDLHPPIA